MRGGAWRAGSGRPALPPQHAHALPPRPRPGTSPRRAPRSAAKPHQPQRQSAAHAAAVAAAISAPRGRAAAAGGRPQAAPATSLAAPAGGSGFTSKTSPLATVLAQYKEAETGWLQEKVRGCAGRARLLATRRAAPDLLLPAARGQGPDAPPRPTHPPTRRQAELRREAAAQRKRANKAELELKRLERLHAHQALDVQALRQALRGRDEQLQEADARAARLEEMVQK